MLCPAYVSINHGVCFEYVIQDLLHFIKNGDLNEIKAIFDEHGKETIDENWKKDNFDFFSPIHEAAESGHNDILSYLLSESIGFDKNELTSHGSHILHLAAYRGKESTVKFIIDKYDISVDIRTTNSKCTPLILAARNGHLDIVKLLIEEYNAEINAFDYSGSTALHRASGWNQPHIIEYLVCDAGADMEIKRNDDGYTSLMLSVYYNKWESVQCLLDLGANIENISFDECTASHIGMERNNYKSLYYLIKRGANIDRICKECCVRNMADYGTFELKQCVKDGLIEYEKYYKNVLNEINDRLNILLCGDIIELIMDCAYPKLQTNDEIEKDKTVNRPNKRKVDKIMDVDESNDSVPPHKKQRLE